MISGKVLSILRRYELFSAQVFLTLDSQGDLSAIVLPLPTRALDTILDFKWTAFYTDRPVGKQSF
jgi:hypothetical protein